MNAISLYQMCNGFICKSMAISEILIDYYKNKLSQVTTLHNELVSNDKKYIPYDLVLLFLYLC